MTSLSIYLLDESVVSIPFRQDMLIGDALVESLRTIGLPDTLTHVLANCFSVCSCFDGARLSLPLSGTAHVQDEIAQWALAAGGAGGGGAPGGRFFLVLRLLTPGVLGAAQVCPALASQLFLSCEHGLLSGSVPCQSVDVGAQLAAQLLYVRSGRYEPSAFPRGSLVAQLGALLPAQLLPKRAPEKWEEAILAAYALMGELAGGAGEARAAFCVGVEDLDLFGYTLFPVRQRFSRSLPPFMLVGIGAEGCVLCERHGTQTVLERVGLQVIELWKGLGEEEGAPGLFHLQLLRQPGLPQVLEFETAEGGVMVKLMNDYAQQLLRELLEEEKVEIVREAARGEAVGARPPGV
jgi:hypothetical protein